MTSTYLPRASIASALHSSVDAELKSLKLLSRRLQSSLTVLSTELQVLHRLYYKNKNQHRGALFWRNVRELQRYIQKVKDAKLQDSIANLRNTFYGPTESVTSMKGSWSHCPTRKYLADLSTQYQVAAGLLDKLSEVSLRAYKSFYRTMQSAAFLQLLLVFVAVASRTRCLALELKRIARDIWSCTEKLTGILFLQPQQTSTEISQTAPSLKNSSDRDLLTRRSDPVANSALAIPTSTLKVQDDLVQEVTAPTKLAAKLNQKAMLISPEGVIVERKRPQKARIEVEQVPQKSLIKNSTDNISGPPNKKKRKVAKNEIDDIFGL